MTQHVEVSRRGHILEVRLNKPKVNAIDHEMSRELGAAFAILRNDPELRVGILTAEGTKIFSAGWDLKAVNSGEMQLDNWWEDGDYGDGGFAGLTENWTLNKPVIAALNGLVIGGGFELALGCDLLIAADHVEFGLPELPLGIVPDAGALQRLPRRIPHNIAMEMFLLGRRMTAEEAARYGLVNKVVPYDELMTTAHEWAEKLASSAPLALQTVKEVLRNIECARLEDAFRTMRTGDLPSYRAMLK
ncbi:MAG: enoyl-CoA hydratase-related protein, partial [Geminicoccaceae bacterium]